MATLSTEIKEKVQDAAKLYHRLILVVGPGQSGKSWALAELHREKAWPLIDVNLELSQRLLELTVKQRALRAATVLDAIVKELGAEISLLDNTEMLFHPELKQDPLRLLQSLARNRTIVATWRGTYVNGTLSYGTPDHPEYQRFEGTQALIVNSAGQHLDRGPQPIQEQQP